jgi:GNAT superfamily N-acetyltransferase
MNIQLSAIKSKDKILKIFKDCKRAMEFENIYQWTEFYPNLDIITNDIRNKELFELHNEGQILGTICLNTVQEKQFETISWSDNNRKILIAHRLAIDPLFQNMGLARKLMTFTEDFALSNGFTSIRLDAFSANKKALNLYENLDYKKTGELYFLGRDLPFFCYEKLLQK